MRLRVVFTIFAVAVLLAAQTPQKPAANAQEPSTIKVDVNEVIVPVTVTNDKGKFVSDLDQKDFQIFDEGKEQNIRFFTRERNQPVVVGFLVDQSNANRLHWKNYQDSAIELVLTLLPGDKKYAGYLVGYNTEAELLVNTTSDSEKLVEKIRKMKPGGGAALYDAIYTSCTNRALVKGEPVEPRRVMIIIGDGHDNASKKSLDQVIEIAQRNLVTIYGVSTVAFGFANEGDVNLRRLAEETGGRVEYPLEGVYSDVSGYLSTPSDEGNYALKVGTGGYASAIATGMFKAVANVAGEVTTQYILRYIPSTGEDTKNSGKVFRRIEVKVNLPNVKVRARKGYYPFNP
ncbi:MAG: VWA domain-containing protein [Bryobacteraceae bacterium]